MARNSNSAARAVPLPNVYTFTVLVHEGSMLSLGKACELHGVQAHRSLLPVDDGDLYSVQLQISCHSQADALHAAFTLGSSYGVKTEKV